MATGRKRRALVLTGAGASLDFGAPSTATLTKAIEKKVCADKWMQENDSDCAYFEISKTLVRYRHGDADAVNFEHIYHCAHELLSTFGPTPSAANEHRPILVPFIKRQIVAEEQALQALVERMAEFIFTELSAVCEKPTRSLDLLAAFLAKLREDHITRIYTVNYDDFLLQAAPDLYTGFNRVPNSAAKSFDGRAFWQATDADCVFHLHGSVHLGFDSPPTPNADLGALYWFDDRATALRHYSSFSVSGEPKMDGSEVTRTAIITGLDKLSRLQQQPFSYYYASIARDAVTADVIYVIGSGLGDLHLNTWLSEARRRNPMPPLIFIDYWRNGFVDDTAFTLERKTIEMFHALRMHVNANYRGVKYGTGWTLDKGRTCAIWDKGFLAFLRSPDELDHVLAELM